MEKQKLPNAVAVLVLGILSIPGCCFYGIGLVLGIVALVLAKKDMALYHSDPALYDGYSNLKTGRILAIIGIVVNVICILMLIALIATFGFAALTDQALMQQRIQEMMGQ